MPQAVAIPALMAITGASSVAGSLLNRPKTGSYSNQPQYSPLQSQMQSQAYDTIMDRMKNPANLDPMKTAAIGATNQTYAGLQKRMESSLAARGFGSSGLAPMNTRAIEVSRAGDIGGLESKFAAMQLDQENRTMDEAMRFGFASPGQTGTQTTPGNMAGGAIGSGLETFSTLFMLDRMLKGGGGGLFSGSPASTAYAGPSSWTPPSYMDPSMADAAPMPSWNPPAYSDYSDYGG